MALRPWTCEQDLGPEYRVNGGIWEPADATPDPSTSQVSFAPDRWGVRPMGQGVSGAQIYGGTRDGFPAFVWPNTNSNRYISVAENFQPKYFVSVIQFQLGTEATADSGITHIIGSPSDTQGGRLRLRQGAGSLNPQDGTWQVAKNGNPTWGPQVLPLPMSVMESIGSFGVTQWGLGRATISGRCWRGPMWYAAMFGEVPPLDVRQKIQGYLAWRFNLQGQLPSDHPYKLAAPMVEDVSAYDARGSAVSASMARGISSAVLSVRGRSVSGARASGIARGVLAAKGRARTAARAGGSAGASVSARGRSRSAQIAEGQSTYSVEASGSALFAHMASGMSSGSMVAVGRAIFGQSASGLAYTRDVTPRRWAYASTSKNALIGPNGLNYTRVPPDA